LPYALCSLRYALCALQLSSHVLSLALPFALFSP
jgi:hypothetical protein